MARFVKGDILIIPFPFSNLKGAKKRPAMVLSNMQGDDLIMLQITSKNIADQYCIPLYNIDFENGSLNQISNIRPNKIFTLDSSIVLHKVGHLKNYKIDIVVSAVISLIS